VPGLRTAFSFFLVLLACGCASLGKDECLHADWYAIGLEDGARGRAVERLGDHRRACAKHNVAPDTERYVAGRNEGLKSFCTYEWGFSEGRAGHGYAAGCPQPQGGQFLAGKKTLRARKPRSRTAFPTRACARTKSSAWRRLPEAEQLELRIQQFK
jgi:hypothetical protein